MSIRRNPHTSFAAFSRQLTRLYFRAEPRLRVRFLIREPHGHNRVQNGHRRGGIT